MKKDNVLFTYIHGRHTSNRTSDQRTLFENTDECLNTIHHYTITRHKLYDFLLLSLPLEI
jgi:hypothetical protein